MVRLIKEEALGLDVASHGELWLALQHGAEPERMTFHGNIKSRPALELAIERGISHIVVDSIPEIDDLEMVAQSRGRPVAVLVRLNLGVGLEGDPKYTTGTADSKFGLSVLDGAARAAIARLRASESLHLRGVHFHLGSQIHRVTPHRWALRRLGELLETEALASNWRPDVVVTGGGMSAKYTDDDQPPSPDDWAAAIVDSFVQHVAWRCNPDVTLGIEPGRSIVAESGTTLYTVGVVKDVALEQGGYRRYVIVDGGLSDNPRPLAYGAKHNVVNASAAESPPEDLVRISGSHCEADTIIPEGMLAPVDRGSVIAVKCTGAYSHAMSSNFNYFLRPSVVLVSGGTARLILRRETLHDLMLREPLLRA